MKLSILQHWAERYAQKLGLTETVKVGWRKDCPKQLARERKRTHCHLDIDDSRGLICIQPVDLKDNWKWLMAHEVCHLKVKSHNSPYFWKWMGRLGFARERAMAQSAGVQKHRHSWGHITISENRLPYHRCQVCGATQIGKIVWGKVTKETERCQI